ncbi:MAG: hypothetical protein AAGG01_23205 [Planctomycetota bacterium]
MFILVSLRPAVTSRTDLPDDSFGSAIIHRLGVPAWDLHHGTPLRFESGDVDGNALADFCALFQIEGEPLSRVVAFPDLAQVVEPWTLSAQATDFAVLPVSTSGPRGVLVATPTGLEVYVGEDTLHVASPLSNSAIFGSCDQLHVTAVGNDVGITARSTSGDLLSALLVDGQLVTYAPQQHQGLRQAVPVEWTPGVMNVAVLDASDLRIVDPSDAREVTSKSIGGGVAMTLRTQSSASTPSGISGRVLCSLLQGPYTLLWSFEEGFEPAYSVVSAGGRAPGDIDFADVDRDGVDDLLLTIQNHPEAWVLYGATGVGGEFPFALDLEPDPEDPTARPLFALTTDPVPAGCMALGDADGDLDTDLVRAESSIGTQLVVRENQIYRVDESKVIMLFETEEHMTEDGAIRDVEFLWENKLWTPAGAGGAPSPIAAEATGIRIDIFLQETPTSTFNRTPWFTETLDVPTGGSVTGTKVTGTVPEAQADAIFRCRLQHVRGTEAIGPATHFIHSFSEPVRNSLESSTVWSEYIPREQSGTQRAGEYKPRGGTTPPIPPPN